MNEMETAVHANEEDLVLYARGELELEYISTVESHLLDCQTCRERLSQCRGETPKPVERPASVSFDEQRKEPRIPTNDSASLRLLSTLEDWNVQVLDVSRSGFRIHTPRFLGSGAIVEVSSRNNVITGEVRYCVQTEGGFYAGLAIQKCVERRGGERLAVDIPGTIAELQNDQAVRIVDRSSEGMRLEAAHAIPQGAPVRIVAEGKLILATVIHCRQDGARFKIGVKVDHQVEIGQ